MVKIIQKEFQEKGYARCNSQLRRKEIERCVAAFEAISKSEARVRKAAKFGSVLEADLPNRKRGGMDPGDRGESIFILGDPPAIDRVFGALAAHPTLVEAAEIALGSREIVLHFMNVTAKAPYIGSGIGWHRDVDNRYMRSRSGRFVRIMVCLDTMGPHNGGTQFQIGSHRLMRPKHGLVTAAPACPAGTVIVVHPQIRHGGPPNRSPHVRRVAVIQYGRRDDPIIAEERESVTGLSPQAIRGRSRCSG